MKRPWVYMSSPSRSPLPPSSPPAPSRSSQSTRYERLSHASNLGWWYVSPLIVYMFRCCSLETSHPRLLPQSLNDCSINLCLFFCSAYRVKREKFRERLTGLTVHQKEKTTQGLSALGSLHAIKFLYERLVIFVSWWRTGRPDMLQSMESQRVGHDWVTELNCFCYNIHLPWDCFRDIAV